MNRTTFGRSKPQTSPLNHEGTIDIMKPLRTSCIGLAVFMPMAVAVAQTSPPTAGTASATPAPPARYALREDYPEVGTNIRREIMKGAIVPIDSHYAQLTPEEKMRWLQQYEAFPANHEPPYPRQGLQALLRQLVSAQRLARAEGPLSLLADVDASGKVTSVSVLLTPDPVLTQAAATALMRTEFKPGVCEGQPCKMQFPMRITFTTDTVPDAGKRAYVPRL